MLNIRLDDVYIGMLALILDVKLNDISSFYLYKKELTLEAKTNLISSKGAERYFFIYENKEFKHFWDLISKNDSSKMTLSFHFYFICFFSIINLA